MSRKRENPFDIEVRIAEAERTLEIIRTEQKKLEEIGKAYQIPSESAFDGSTSAVVNGIARELAILRRQMVLDNFTIRKEMDLNLNTMKDAIERTLEENWKTQNYDADKHIEMITAWVNNYDVTEKESLINGIEQELSPQRCFRLHSAMMDIEKAMRCDMQKTLDESWKSIGERIRRMEMCLKQMHPISENVGEIPSIRYAILGEWKLVKFECDNHRNDDYPETIKYKLVDGKLKAVEECAPDLIEEMNVCGVRDLYVEGNHLKTWFSEDNTTDRYIDNGKLIVLRKFSGHFLKYTYEKVEKPEND